MDVAVVIVCPNCELVIFNRPAPIAQPSRVTCTGCGAVYALDVREIKPPAERKRLQTGGGYKR